MSQPRAHQSPSRTGAAVRRMAALVALFAVALAAAPPAIAGSLLYGSGVLWRIEGQDMVPPSYLFGTLHLTDERVTNLPAAVTGAVARSTSMTVEVVSSPEKQAQVARMMLLTNGDRLDGIVGPELFAEVARASARYGLPANSVKMLKPWAITVTLSISRAELARQAAGRLPLDKSLSVDARARGVPVYGLETVEEQLNIFDSLDRADQIALLRQAVRDNPRIDEIANTITTYYLKRDLEGLLAWMAEQTAGRDRHLLDLFWSRFVNARNETMARRMRPRLKEGGAFIAVGALHLPGENGILNLLASQGYKLRRVY